jgi:hypothetical protein
MAQQEQGNNGRDFASVELIPAREGELLWPPAFRVFQVDVKSDSEIGGELHVDPLTVLRRRVPDMGLDDETRAQVLRVNAERPANPMKRREIWIVYPENTTAVGIQYKYER